MSLVATYLGDNQASVTTTISLAVTTTGTAGRIILVINNEDAHTPASMHPTHRVSSIVGLGATWLFRAVSPLDNSLTGTAWFAQSSELWYADVPVSWGSGTITVTLNNGGFDDATIHAVHVGTSSADTIVRFDTNPRLPGILLQHFPGSGNSPVPVLSLSSDSPAPFVFLCSGSSYATFPGSPTPAGIALLGSRSNAGGVNWETSTMYGGTTTQLEPTITGFLTPPNNGVNLASMSYIFDALHESPQIFQPPTDVIVPQVYLGGPDPVYGLDSAMQRLMRHFTQRVRGRNIFKMSDGTFQDSQVNGTPPNMIQPPTSPYARAIYESGGALLETDFFQVPYVVRTYYGGTLNIITATEAAALQAAGYTTGGIGV